MSIEESGEYQLPSNPADRDKIKANIQDIVDQMTIIDSYKEKIKEIVQALKEDHGVPPKVANRLAKARYKQSFDKEVNEAESFAATYELLFRGSVVDHDDEDETEE